MPKKQTTTNKAQKDMEALVEKALREPGVAEAVEVYERAEAVYAAVSRATWTSQSATDSTGEESAS